jgi:hypothetical protein
MNGNAAPWPKTIRDSQRSSSGPMALSPGPRTQTPIAREATLRRWFAALLSEHFAVYTSLMAFELDNKIFPLPNARRLLVEPFGVRIMDKSGRTRLESGPKKETCFDRSLSEADRRLLSELKIRR